MVVCQGGQRPVATIKTHGLIGRLVECSGAGVHYDSPLQRRLAMAVAEHIRVVSPARSAP